MLRYVAALPFECVDALHQHVFHVQEFLERRHGILKVSGKLLTPVQYNTPDGRKIGSIPLRAWGIPPISLHSKKRWQKGYVFYVNVSRRV